MTRTERGCLECRMRVREGGEGGYFLNEDDEGARGERAGWRGWCRGRSAGWRIGRGFERLIRTRLVPGAGSRCSSLYSKSGRCRWLRNTCCWSNFDDLRRNRLSAPPPSSDSPCRRRHLNNLGRARPPRTLLPNRSRHNFRTLRPHDLHSRPWSGIAPSKGHISARLVCRRPRGRICQSLRG